VLAEHEVLMVEAVLLQQGRNGFTGDGADVQPVLAAVDLGDELLALVLVSGVIETQLLDHAPVAR
jgi:hypothetical protein